MKLRQSSLDIYAFTGKYRDQLEGSFIKKVFQVSRNEFLLQVYRSDLKRRDLYLSLSKGIAYYSPPHPDQASQLSIILRKNLSERRIMAVQQINFDRIVKITLSTGQELILEMFREGNLIITDGNVITFALNQREWKNRKILVGEVYRPPGETDPLSFDADAFRETVKKSKASLVQTLATRMNLGGETSEELLHRAEIDKDTPASGFEDYEILLSTFRELLQESLQGKAYYYHDALTLSPVVLNHISAHPDRIFEDLNDGIAFYFDNYPEGEKELTPLERRLESQKRTIEEYNAKAEKLQRCGTVVISNLRTIQSILDETKENEREIKAGTVLRSSSAEVVAFDAGKKTVTVSFMEEQIPLSYETRATENANSLFQESKDLKAKASAAGNAVEDTIKSMSFREEKPKKKKRTKHWFEIYHWFFSSEGFLVVSGKDRKTNEKVVKKHMKEGDLYVHADMYGAPSTVIKSEGDRKPGEQTIREACIFAVAQSRAWSAGIASGSAYWVYPEQVSKTPESGEYVSTGSWIVRGKRNYLFDLPLELVIEVIEYSSDTIPMIHPPFESGEQEGKQIRIRPGNIKRTGIVKEIAEMLEVPADDVDPLLPPGGSVVVQQ